MGSANLPLISRLRAKLLAVFFPQGEAFLQESFRTTRQGNEWEHLYTPSSVAYGATFPLEGEGYCADFFRFCLEILAFECLKSKMVISKI